MLDAARARWQTSLLNNAEHAQHQAPYPRSRTSMEFLDMLSILARLRQTSIITTASIPPPNRFLRDLNHDHTRYMAVHMRMLRMYHRRLRAERLRTPVLGTAHLAHFRLDPKHTMAFL